MFFKLSITFLCLPSWGASRVELLDIFRPYYKFYKRPIIGRCSFKFTEIYALYPVAVFCIIKFQTLKCLNCIKVHLHTSFCFWKALKNACRGSWCIREGLLPIKSVKNPKKLKNWNVEDTNRLIELELLCAHLLFDVVLWVCQFMREFIWNHHNSFSTFLWNQQCLVLLTPKRDWKSTPDDLYSQFTVFPPSC